MFRFTTAGESHGRALVAIVEGLPAGLAVEVEAVNRELERRQWGYGRGGRMKIERDRAEILSGVRHGLTLGSPVALSIENKDWANWQDVMAAEPRELEDAKARRLRRPRPGRGGLVSSSAAIGASAGYARPRSARRGQAPMRVADRARASIWRLVSVRSSVLETQ